MEDNNIPNSVSLEMLKELQSEAVTEAEVNKPKKKDGPFDGLTKGEMIDEAEEIVASSLEKCSDPMFHKMIVITILAKMIEWHTVVGGEQRDGEDAVAWLRDAGKLQAAMGIMQDIGMGPDDWFMTA